MNKSILIGFVLLALFLAGCENIDVSKMSDADLQRIADKAIVCNAPYIRHATGCCLDNNNNSVCDPDETPTVTPQLPVVPNTTPDKPSEPNKPEKVWTKEQILSDCEVFKSFYEKCNDLNLVDKCVKKYGEDPIEAGQVPEKDECYVQVLCSDLAGSREYNTMRTKCSGNSLPDKCTLPSGVACLDFVRTASGVTMIIQNSGGFDMTRMRVVLKDLAGTTLSTCTSSSGSDKLADGAKDTFTCGVSSMPDPFKASIEIFYTNAQTGMMHTKTGELILYVNSEITKPTSPFTSRRCEIPGTNNECGTGAEKCRAQGGSHDDRTDYADCPYDCCLM